MSIFSFNINEWAKKHAPLLSLLGVAIGIVGIIMGVVIAGIDDMAGELIATVSIALTICVVIFALSIFFFLKQRKIRVYVKREEETNFDVDKKLKKVIKLKANLTVAGRTNVVWFEDPKEMKPLYEKALENGSQIKFIMQHEHVKNDDLDAKNRKIQLQGHKTTIKNYEEIHRQLDPKWRDNFKLVFTTKPINNSITDIFTGKGAGRKHPYFSYDIGLRFEGSSSPMLAFHDNSVKNVKNMLTALDNIDTKGLPDFFECESRRERAGREIADLIEGFKLASKQRANDNEKLVYHYYERQKALNEGDGFFPPVSIQLLITSDCTAGCVMCKHREITSKGDLKTQDIKNIIDYIRDLGTKNIIISGGEPLFQPDCIEILEYAKRKGLNVGLLTNGIKPGGKPLTEPEAMRIRAACSWVQLSIDSFVPEIYKSIRKVDYGVVMESLRWLDNSKDKHKDQGYDFEIAYTIQDLNIEEAIELITTNEPNAPSDKIRFKFAHGPDNHPDGEPGFLLSGKRELLGEFVSACRDNGRYNTDYLTKMFWKGDGSERPFFKQEDIAAGEPLKGRNHYYQDKKYTCQILNYSCKIDSKGDVYPCCFLYDDNSGDNSDIRKGNNLGHLHDGASVVPSLKDLGWKNPLKKLLNNEIPPYRERRIPLEPSACNNCTRHFYQNEFLNELERIADNKKYKEIGYTYPTDKNRTAEYEKIWI